jgi:hypothetical protein
MSFNKLDATVFVYRSRIDGRIHAEYIDTAREMDKSPDWEHIATLEPRLWIQHNYAAPQPQREQDTLNCLWARNGHDVCPTTTPQPQREQEPMTPREIAAFVGTHEFGPDQLKWFRLGEYVHAQRKRARVSGPPRPPEHMMGRADDTALLRQALEILEKLNEDGWILADFEQEVWTAITTLKERLK